MEFGVKSSLHIDTIRSVFWGALAPRREGRRGGVSTPTGAVCGKTGPYVVLLFTFVVNGLGMSNIFSV